MAAKNLKGYRKIVGSEVIDSIYAESEKVKGKHIVCISSTYQGGGVAEMLNSLIPLFDEVGIKHGWRVLHGTPDFFTITKKFHNSLQGDDINLSQRKKKIFFDTNKRFSSFTHLGHDLVIVHDPQPLPMIDMYEKKQPWIFRCHIDLTTPSPKIWNYLRTFIDRYDAMVVSREEYMKPDLKIPQMIMHPTIDPLSPKNEFLAPQKIDKFLLKHGIEKDKPIISQISRFDKWKDPKGVIDVFEKVRKKRDCRLVLLGSLATDDPEGLSIYEHVKKKTEKSKYRSDIDLLLVENHILANSLQKASHVVIQKSLREGFGLTVSEAMYKCTPVVASRVGGIPLQVINGVNGFLHEPHDVKGFAESVIKILDNDELRITLGKNGREHVKNNFLITKQMLEWIKIFQMYLK